MRTLIAAVTILAGAACLAQEEAYSRIQWAVQNTHAQERFHMNIGGWSRVDGEAAIDYRLRLWVQGNQFWGDLYIDDEHRLRIVADGSLVWRYDPLANEYTHLKQEAQVQRAFGTASAWMRSEMQRPLRLLAGSARWLVRPMYEMRDEPGNRYVRLWDTRPVGQDDWRGTDLRFRFDEENRMERLTIHERLDIGGGKVREAAYTGDFFYLPFEFAFEYTPPANARPAADLPKRGDG